MKFSQIVGPSYRSQSVNANAQACVNQYPEKDETGEGRSPYQSLPTPGLKPFFVPRGGAGEIGPIGSIFQTPNGSVYAIIGLTPASDGRPRFEVLQIASDGSGVRLVGSYTGLGVETSVNVAISSQYAAFAIGTPGVANSGLLVYFDHTAPFPTLNVAVLTGGVASVVFLDGYFLALIQNSSKVQYTLDVTTWDALDIFQVSVTSDYVTSMIVDHRELILCGAVDTVVYNNVGDADNPFQPNPSGFIQQGIAAPPSLIQLDNTVFFIGGDGRGNGIGWRLNGYTPQRVTTKAVEFAWQGYSTIADAVAYPYQDQGHSFWVIYFPTANKTWVYDVGENAWHEREHRDPTTGIAEAHRSWVHQFAFGKHLVGDWKTGNIYEMHIPVTDGNGGWNFVTDELTAGVKDPIRRYRRATHVTKGGERVFIDSLQVFVEPGLGPIPALVDGDGNPRGPILSLSVSKDGGHSFGQEMERDCGQAGEFNRRVIWRRLGQGRDIVLELSASDPIPWRIIDAELIAS
jgi:hypothetical protein